MFVETFKNRLLRYVLTLFGLTSVLLFPICSAYADGGGGSHNFDASYPNFGTVWFDNKGVGGVAHTLGVRYGVVAYTQYDAAVYCCKGSSFDFDGLSARKKQKLLANGKFTSFANLFSVGKPAATDDWSSDAEITLAWNKARSLYGETYCYSGIYTVDAKLEVQTVIDNVLKEPDVKPPVTGGDAFVQGSTTYLPVVKWGSGLKGEVSYVCGPTSDFNKLKSYADSKGYKIYGWVFNGGVYSNSYASQDQFLVYQLWASPEDNITYNDDYTITLNTTFSTPVLHGYSLKSTGDSEVQYLSNVTVNGVVKKCAYCSTYVDNVVYGAGKFRTPLAEKDSNGNTRWWTFKPTYYVSEYKESGGGSDEPEPDPPTWPTPPVDPNPDPPEVPTPGDPTVDPNPDPPTPTPPTPWNPIPDIGIEITGEDFQDLIDALDEHCKHLQQAIQSNISQLWDLQSDFLGDQFSDLFTQLGDNFSWLGNDVIVTSFGDLKSYLKELFDWLSERMDFNISVEGGQYDDTSLLYWVKQIWSKLGDGINTQPTDPVAESDDWWAWLLALMGNFVGMLLAFGADKLGDVTSALQTLTGKFPFSLPWDLAAMFALLDAPAVTPAFDLPCYTVTLEGLQEVGTYHITLEAFDDVWNNVRWVERIGFVVMLIKSTDLITGVMRKAVGRD